MTDTIIRRHIPEIPVEGKPLGRHVVHDPRSWNFQADKAPELISVNHACGGLPLNQGSIGSCTGNALTGALDTAPNWAPGNLKLTEADAIVLYRVETRNEGQPYPPNDPGGSGLNVCKAAKQLGVLSGYKHAFGILHALLALVNKPVITGIDWFTSFDTPDPTTAVISIAPGATVRGGHEIVAVEIQVPAGVTAANAMDHLDEILVGFEQSWGLDFGQGGRFYMTAATWNALLSQQGDVTVLELNPAWVRQHLTVPAQKPAEPEGNVVNTIEHVKISKAAAIAAVTEAVGLAVAVVPNLAADKSILIAAGTSVVVAVSLIANCIHALAGAKLSAGSSRAA